MTHLDDQTIQRRDVAVDELEKELDSIINLTNIDEDFQQLARMAKLQLCPLIRRNYSDAELRSINNTLTALGSTRQQWQHPSAGLRKYVRYGHAIRIVKLHEEWKRAFSVEVHP